MLPEVDPAFVEGVVVDEARDTDDGDDDHEDLETEECGEAEFLLDLHFDTPEDIYWNCQDCNSGQYNQSVWFFESSEKHTHQICENI